MPARPLGVPQPQAKGLPGSGGHYRKTGYFSRITAFRPVGHVFVWLAHLQLIYHLDFINNRKNVKKYILLYFLISFPKNHEN